MILCVTHGAECESTDDSLNSENISAPCFARKVCLEFRANRATSDCFCTYRHSSCSHELPQHRQNGFLDFYRPFCRVKYHLIHSEDSGSFHSNNAIVVIQAFFWCITQHFCVATNVLSQSKARPYKNVSGEDIGSIDMMVCGRKWHFSKVTSPAYDSHVVSILKPERIKLFVLLENTHHFWWGMKWVQFPSTLTCTQCRVKLVEKKKRHEQHCWWREKSILIRFSMWQKNSTLVHSAIFKTFQGYVMKSCFKSLVGESWVSESLLFPWMTFNKMQRTSLKVQQPHCWLYTMERSLARVITIALLRAAQEVFHADKEEWLLHLLKMQPLLHTVYNTEVTVEILVLSHFPARLVYIGRKLFCHDVKFIVDCVCWKNLGDFIINTTSLWGWSEDGRKPNPATANTGASDAILHVLRKVVQSLNLLAFSW